MFRRQGSLPLSDDARQPALATAPVRPLPALRPGRRTVLAALLTSSFAGQLRLAGAQPQPVATPGTPAAAPRAEIPLPPLGSMITVPDLTLLDGSQLTTAGRAGKTMVLYWWASWCPFCAEQSPLMDRLSRGEGDHGLLVLGLSVDRQPEPAQAYLKRKGYVFPSAWLSPELARVLPKPKGLPVTVVLSPEGRVLAAESGQMFDEDVADLARWAPAAR